MFLLDFKIISSLNILVLFMFVLWYVLRMQLRAFFLPATGLVFREARPKDGVFHATLPCSPATFIP